MSSKSRGLTFQKCLVHAGRRQDGDSRRLRHQLLSATTSARTAGRSNEPSRFSSCSELSGLACQNDGLSTIRRPANGTTAAADAAVPTLAEQAYDALRDGILRGQLPPGTPLSRRRIAATSG